MKNLNLFYVRGWWNRTQIMSGYLLGGFAVSMSVGVVMFYFSFWTNYIDFQCQIRQHKKIPKEVFRFEFGDYWAWHGADLWTTHLLNFDPKSAELTK